MSAKPRGWKEEKWKIVTFAAASPGSFVELRWQVHDTAIVQGRNIGVLHDVLEHQRPDVLSEKSITGFGIWIMHKVEVRDGA